MTLSKGFALKINIFLCFVIFNTNIAAAPSGTVDTIVFDNFGQQITLLRKEGDSHYRIEGVTAEAIMVSNQLIVKTEKSISKDMAIQFHSQIVGVKLLFSGLHNNYYLVDVADSAMLSNVLSTLKQHQAVSLVQPDLLQIANHVGRTSSRLDTDRENIRKQRLKRRKSRALQRKKINLNDAPPLTLSTYLKLLALPLALQQNRGQGVKVAIIDDGFDLGHRALNHVNPTFSYDVSNSRLSAESEFSHDSHGTKVAGIIFADDKQHRVVGIAPQAQLIALRHVDTWTSKTMLSFQLAHLAQADIINCSWLAPRLMQPVAEIINELAMNGRNGKGTIIVFAAGNQGVEIFPNSNEASLDAAIVVGAHDSNFARLKNSNFGPTIDVTTYGGKVLTTFPDNKIGRFSNTSLASAVVTGIVARILSTEPQLSMQQTQYTLQRLLSVDNKMQYKG